MQSADPITETPWSRFVDLYSRLEPPLRPSPCDVATLAAAIAGNDDSVLLLGVTPELSSLGRRLRAFDISPRAVEALAPNFPSWTVPVAIVRDAVEAMFPDRAALSRVTGWSRAQIDTIDFYREAAHRIAFPSLSRLLEAAQPVFAGTAVFSNGPYPLSERCPTLVLSHDPRVSEIR